MVIYENAEKLEINDEANKIPPDLEATPTTTDFHLMMVDLTIKESEKMRGTEYPLKQQIKVLTFIVSLLITTLTLFLLEQKQMLNKVHLGHMTHHMMESYPCNQQAHKTRKAQGRKVYIKVRQPNRRY